jgi:putative ABC transport system permease protein
MEVAFALLLLVGAGLLLRSFSRLQSVDPGFNQQSLLTFRVPLSVQKYDSDAKRVEYFRGLISQLQRLPGVISAGAIDTLPFTIRHSGTSIDVVGQPDRAPGDGLSTGVCVTDVNYFKTMQIPLKRGRLYTDDEAREMRHVVVVNEAFVRENLNGEDPLGKRVVIYMKDDNQPSEIIGVVADNKHLGLDVKVRAVAFWPHPELVYPEMTVVVRSEARDATSLMPAIREVIARLDPQQPVTDITTMENLMAASVAKSRFNATLLAVFAAVALIMASVGIYGVMSYTVAQRTHEIGIRVALGAQRRNVLNLVLVHGMVLGLIGVAIGLAASFGLTRLLSTLLFEIDARDKTTFALVPVVLLAVTLLACYIPARRATKVNPLVALRYE